MVSRSGDRARVEFQATGGMEVFRLRGHAVNVDGDSQGGLVVDEPAAIQVDLEEYVKETLRNFAVVRMFRDGPRRWGENAPQPLPCSGHQSDAVAGQAQRDDLGIYDVQVSVRGSQADEIHRVIQRIGSSDDQLGSITRAHDQIRVRLTVEVGVDSHQGTVVADLVQARPASVNPVLPGSACRARYLLRPCRGTEEQ